MPGFLKNLKNIFSAPSLSGSGSSSSGFIPFKIRCDKCGEEIIIKIRSTNELSRIYDEDESGPPGSVFFIRKEILGNKCSNLIYFSAYFGENFKPVSYEISGGKIVE